MPHPQYMSKSNNSQQNQSEGSINAPYASNGGISIGGDNHGIVITSIPTPEKPQRRFNITKQTRIPIPASLIGILSGLVTLTGFITGGFTFKQLIGIFHSGTGFGLTSGTPREYWWLLGSLLIIGVGLIGWSFFRFLRRNVLRLPRRWYFRAWAGIKGENGRTYPYTLRLAMRCPACKNQKLRFQQTPAATRDIHDGQTGAYKKTVVTKWKPMAVCPRDEEHSIHVNISDNDFDEALPR